MTFSPIRTATLLLAVAVSAAIATDAVAKTVVIGPVSVDVADDFQTVAGKPSAIRQASTGITVEASALPSEAVHEFQGPAFLDYLQSLGFTSPTYASDGLKRTDPHTYVLADAKGADGPEKRFLLVIGGAGRAAIVSAYAPVSELANGHASRAAIDAILDSATVIPAPAAKQ